MNGRRLGYDAARLEFCTAQNDARVAAVRVRMARAEATRIAADRAVSLTDAAAVSSARRALREAQLNAKAATARMKAARARVSAERTALGAAELPLDRLRARHDAILTRWMDYETDPAKLLAFPSMSDGRDPQTTTFLTALERARDLRPPRESNRITARDFSHYRRAVDDLERAFDIAERSARGEKVQPDIPDSLRDAARSLLDKSAEMLNRSTDLLSDWNTRRRER